MSDNHDDRQEMETISGVEQSGYRTHKRTAPVWLCVLIFVVGIAIGLVVAITTKASKEGKIGTDTTQYPPSLLAQDTSGGDNSKNIIEVGNLAFRLSKDADNYTILDEVEVSDKFYQPCWSGDSDNISKSPESRPKLSEYVYCLALYDKSMSKTDITASDTPLVAIAVPKYAILAENNTTLIKEYLTIFQQLYELGVDRGCLFDNIQERTDLDGTMYYEWSAKVELDDNSWASFNVYPDDFSQCLICTSGCEVKDIISGVSKTASNIVNINDFMLDWVYNKCYNQWFSDNIVFKILKNLGLDESKGIPDVPVDAILGSIEEHFIDNSRIKAAINDFGDDMSELIIIN